MSAFLDRSNSVVANYFRVSGLIFSSAVGAIFWVSCLDAYRDFKKRGISPTFGKFLGTATFGQLNFYAKVLLDSLIWPVSIPLSLYRAVTEYIQHNSVPDQVDQPDNKDENKDDAI